MVATARQSDSLYDVFRQGARAIEMKMSKMEFEAFALRHQELQMEREADGTVIIMPLNFGGSGMREDKVGFHVQLWQRQTKRGLVCGSTNGFDLPDGATKAPDAAWLSPERLGGKTMKDFEYKFIDVVPDFIIELRSSSDRLKKVQQKMKETWMKNGVRLGWLIDPYDDRVYIYREHEDEPEVVEGMAGKILSGENVCPGLELPLDELIE